MSKIDPATWTQLIIATATLLTAIAGWLKSQSNSKKIDQNTDLTKDIHQVTNGPLTNMEATVGNIETQIASHAAQARSTAEAAKVQAAVDADKSQGNPNAKTPPRPSDPVV
jgi:hypothetical protein